MILNIIIFMNKMSKDNRKQAEYQNPTIRSYTPSQHEWIYEWMIIAQQKGKLFHRFKTSSFFFFSLILSIFPVIFASLRIRKNTGRKRSQRQSRRISKGRVEKKNIERGKNGSFQVSDYISALSDGTFFSMFLLFVHSRSFSRSFARSLSLQT